MLDRLPTELKFYIFKMVDINDYINLRLVNKKFNNLISEVKVDELVLIENDFDDAHNELKKKRKWFIIDKPLTNVVKINSKLVNKFLETPSFNFKYLKRLIVHSSIDHKELSTDDLLKLQSLEHLEFDYLVGENILSLPNLKIFRQHTLINGSLVIDSPRLSTVHIRYGLKEVQFINPLTLKHFESLELTDYLFNFVNLERICVDHCRLDDERSILSQFQNLKEIKFDLVEYSYSYYMETMEVLKKLVEEKRDLERSDVSIVFNGKQIESYDQIDSLQPNEFYSDTSGDSDFLYSDSYDSDNCFYEDDCHYESDNSLAMDLYEDS